jgi:hypothetical protein
MRDSSGLQSLAPPGELKRLYECSSFQNTIFLNQLMLEKVST